jgi:hypothetical protein
MIDLNEVTISSKRFAELINKSHSSVLNKCDSLIKEGLSIDTGNPKAEEKEYRISLQVADKFGVDLTDKFQELKEVIDYLVDKRRNYILNDELIQAEHTKNIFCAIWGLPRDYTSHENIEHVKFEVNDRLEEKIGKSVNKVKMVTNFEGYDKNGYLSDKMSDIILEFFGINISAKEIDRIAYTYYLLTSEFCMKIFFEGSFYIEYHLPTSNHIVKYFKIENGII